MPGDSGYGLNASAAAQVRSSPQMFHRTRLPPERLRAGRVRVLKRLELPPPAGQGHPPQPRLWRQRDGVGWAAPPQLQGRPPARRLLHRRHAGSLQKWLSGCGGRGRVCVLPARRPWFPRPRLPRPEKRPAPLPEYCWCRLPAGSRWTGAEPGTPEGSAQAGLPGGMSVGGRAVVLPRRLRQVQFPGPRRRLSCGGSAAPSGQVLSPGRLPSGPLRYLMRLYPYSAVLHPREHRPHSGAPRRLVGCPRLLCTHHPEVVIVSLEVAPTMGRGITRRPVALFLPDR